MGGVIFNRIECLICKTNCEFHMPANMQLLVGKFFKIFAFGLKAEGEQFYVVKEDSFLLLQFRKYLFLFFRFKYT